MQVLDVVLLVRGWGCCGRPQGNCLQTASTETIALNWKNNCIIEDAVKRPKERVILAEIFLPLCRVAVAGEGLVVIAVFLVSAVHHIKEQPRVLLVKLPTPHFINNEAGRPGKGCEECTLTSRQPVGHLSFGHAIPSS